MGFWRHSLVASGMLLGLAGTATGASDRSTPEVSPSANLTLRNSLLIGAGAALVGYFGVENWWQDGFSDRFRVANEGWFGQGTENGGADKLGHVFFTYTGARVLARGFDAVGNAPEASAKLGFWSALGVMTAVEIADGFSNQYRFSPQDAMMNVAGAGLAYAMETNPALDRMLDFRLLYKPSAGSSFDPGGDYSGQIYLLAFKANAWPALQSHPVIRYLEFAVGYGARGFEGNPPADPQRNLYVGLSINLSELLRGTLFKNTAPTNYALRTSDLLFEFYQVPGTATLLRNRL